MEDDLEGLNHGPRGKTWVVSRERLEDNVIKTLHESAGVKLWRGHARMVVDSVLLDLARARKLVDVESLFK